MKYIITEPLSLNRHGNTEGAWRKKSLNVSEIVKSKLLKVNFIRNLAWLMAWGPTPSPPQDLFVAEPFAMLRGRTPRAQWTQSPLGMHSALSEQRLINPKIYFKHLEGLCAI